MINEKKYKKVGEISLFVCELCNIKDYLNLAIYESYGLIHHAKKHLSEFTSKGYFFKALNHISDILSNPYFVYYDAMKKSLRYYKKINEYVCVVVNIKSSYAYIATIYPVNKNTIDRLILKQKFIMKV